ncbi:MAG: hypothetical protein OWS74_05350 [Firmicutes bacterium]|nr:hypothetical protein [Bacillota bacterium]
MERKEVIKGGSGKMINKPISSHALYTTPWYTFVYVDIDKPYKTIKYDNEWKGIYRGIQQLTEFNIDIRPSSHGNTHMRVYRKDGNLINFVDSMKIRALLHDDPYRFEYDWIRNYYEGIGETNRIFSMKITKDNICKAGAWIPLKQYLESD